MNVGCKKGWKRGIFFSLMRNEDLTCVQYDFHCWLQQCSDDFFWSQRGHILWATYITSAGELSWPPTMEEKLLWHPWRPTPCRHTVGAGGWWYMCSGEIVKSIWMSAGPPWSELELAGFFFCPRHPANLYRWRGLCPVPKCQSMFGASLSVRRRMPQL